MRPEQIPVKGVANGTAYSVHGTGEPLVLIHGVGMEQDAWMPQISALAREHQVIVYDMLGHGGSRIPDEGVTLADYAAQLAGLMDHLGLAAANVVGHSMGALVALEFALAYPARTLRVAALNAVFMRTPEQQAAVMARAAALQDIGVQATVDSTIARWFGDPVPPALRDSASLVRGILARVHPQGYARTYQLFASCDRVHADRLITLAMPALFMTGELDPNSSPSMSQAMAQRTPLSTLDIVPGARHMMNMTDPQRVNQGLQKFLAQPLARSGAQRATASHLAA
jgi:pimeloyl-ACP methyl ester carboxylesterase